MGAYLLSNLLHGLDKAGKGSQNSSYIQRVRNQPENKQARIAYPINVHVHVYHLTYA